MLPMIAAALAMTVSPVMAGDAGKGVFVSKCASCHGKDGKGTASMAKMLKLEASALDLTKESTAKLDEAALLALIEGGKGKMPAYKGKLKPEELADVSAYVKSLSVAATTQAPAEIPGSPAAGGAGEAAYKKSCASCHGKDLKGNAGMAKMFKVDNAALDLVDEATLAKTDEDLVKVTAEGVAKMPAYKAKLKPEEIQAIVDFIRSSAPRPEAKPETK